MQYSVFNSVCITQVEPTHCMVQFWYYTKRLRKSEREIGGRPWGHGGRGSVGGESFWVNGIDYELGSWWDRDESSPSTVFS